jgi:hypothetical protein
MWGTFCYGHPEVPYKNGGVIDECPQFFKLYPEILL